MRMFSFTGIVVTMQITELSDTLQFLYSRELIQVNVADFVLLLAVEALIAVYSA